MDRIRWLVKFGGGLVVVALFLVACNQAVAPGSQELDAQAAGDRYIVVLNEAASVSFPGQGRAVAAQVARGYGLQATHTYGAAIVGFAAHIPPARLAQLQQDPRVKYVETDDPVQLFTQTVPTGVQRIFAEANANIDIDGTDDYRVDVDVAVIDTGIDWEHPDLNVVNGIDCSGGGPFNSSCKGNGDDDHYHGTHVAGTIAAIDDGQGVVGVAPGARLWAVKVLDSRGSGYTSWIIAGIDWVTANADAIEVANMSLGGSGFNQAEYDAIQASVNAGVAYAVAAGNSNADASNYSPAAFDNVLTVSALADFDGAAGGNGSPSCRTDQDDTLADFSNWGPAVDITAPGVCILSTYPIEQGSYGTISGTSMASPHAAGALALLASGQNAPISQTDVEAFYKVLKDKGNSLWTDDSDDGTKEPLLDVSNTTTFQPTLIAGGGGGGDTSDAAPTASISSPLDGAAFDSGASVSFSGSANDEEDGDLTTTLVWTSDLDGQIGTGGSFDHGLSDGTHVVTASVTDSAGQTASDAVSVTVGHGTGISLSVSTTKQRGVKIADLAWGGATSTNVDIYRDGSKLTSTANDGSYTDNTGDKGGGSYTYQVCEEGMATCSDVVTATF